MDIIRFDCPRCGVHLHVPAAKAGRQGRCPTCGGRIRVPGEETVEHIGEAAAHHHGWAITAVVSMVLALMLLGVIVFRSGGEGPSQKSEAGKNAGQSTQAELDRIRNNLVQVYRLEDRLADYRASIMREKRLRAREVRMRLTNYERVSPYECSLREEVLAQWNAYVQTVAKTGGIPREDWQLNTPLTALEKEDLVILSEKLNKQTLSLFNELRSARIRIQPQTDPLGRRLLDSDKVQELIAGELDRLKKLESDVLSKQRS